MGECGIVECGLSGRGALAGLRGAGQTKEGGCVLEESLDLKEL